MIRFDEVHLDLDNFVLDGWKNYGDLVHTWTLRTRDGFEDFEYLVLLSDKIKAAVSKRDDIIQDDLIGIILDTFNDMQSGFGFLINPLGIQGDGMMGVEGNLEPSLDMVWFSKGRIDELGYTVECRIPLKSIRFPNKKVLPMRILFFRFFIRTMDKLDFTLSLSYSDLFRDADGEKIYDYILLRSRNTFQVNKYLFLRGIVEYNFYRDRLTVDTLASFTYIPGTVIHVG